MTLEKDRLGHLSNHLAQDDSKQMLKGPFCPHRPMEMIADADLGTKNITKLLHIA